MAAPVRTPDSQRPAPRAALPFRIRPPGVNGISIIEWEEEVLTVSDRRHLTFSMRTSDRPGPQILALMQMFWEVEAKVDVLAAERDELQAANRLLEGQVRSLQGKVDEARRRVKG